jgi:Tfp pilus assembly protein PilN
MIKINLLPTKRAKGRGRAAASEPGSRELVIGAASLAGVAAIVFFAVDAPRRSHLRSQQESNQQIQQEIAAKQKQLDGPPSYEVLKKAGEEADQRATSIGRLMAAKVVPANVLHELGEILTNNHFPTMTDEMTKLTGNGIDGNPNKRFDPQWDPQHVWLTSFVDKGGKFTLQGGAQGESDVTQLSLRLQASAYFQNVTPSQEERVADRESGINYFRFTITGKVAY